MAIVDKTHSQTIEEAFSQVAEGGSGGDAIKIIPYFIGDAVTPMVGGFVKGISEEEPGYVYYTVEEMDELFEQYKGMLFTISFMNERSSVERICYRRIGNNYFYEAEITRVYMPSIDSDETAAYGTRDYVRVSSNEGYYVNRSNWTWAVTNDD